MSPAGTTEARAPYQIENCSGDRIAAAFHPLPGNLRRHHLQNLPPNRQRCRRRRRRHIQHVQKPFSPHKPEIIHQRAIRPHRLRPHSRPARRHVFHPHRRHQPLAGPHQLPLLRRPPKLRQPIFPVPPRHRPKPRIHEHFHRFAPIEIPPPVSLPPERQHRVRPRIHIPLNPPREVHSQERILRIRHRINQPPHQLPARRRQIVILHATRNAHHPRIVSRHPRHPIAIQPRAIHHIPRRKISRSRPHHHRVPRRVPRTIESHHACVRLHLRPASHCDLRILRRHRRIIRDPR